MKKSTIIHRSLILMLIPLSVVFTSTNGYSQTTNADCRSSIKHLYKDAKRMEYYESDSFLIIIDSLNKHIESCMDTNVYVSIKLLEQTYYLTKKENKKVDSIKTNIQEFFGSDKPSNAYYLYLLSLAVQAHVAARVSEARTLYRQIYENTQPDWKNVYHFKTKVLSNWASLEIDQGNYDKALSLLEEALGNVKKYGKDKSEEAINTQLFNLYNSMGILMKRIKDLDKASYYYSSAMSLFPKKHKSHITALTNYLEVLQLQDSTKKIIHLAEEYIDLTKNKNNLSYLYSHLMEAYLDQEKQEEAGSLYHKIEKEFNDTSKLTVNIMQRILKSEGHYLLSKGEVENAKEKYYQRLKIIEGQNLEIVRASILQDLVQSFIYDNKKELKLYNQYIDIMDSIQLAKVSSEIKRWETKYQTKEKEAQNKLLQAEKEVQEATIKKQQVWMSGLGVGLTGLLFGLFMFGKRSRERKKHIDVLASKNEKIHALNRETIHRTKNYLHLATALLNKNKVNTDDPQIAEVLAENEKRLKVLSKINTKLSASDGKTHLSAKEYLSELIDDLSFSFQQTRQRGASIQAHVADVLLDSDKCLYLGLIINELIVNSFKHARPEGALQIVVDVAQTADDRIQLTYHDNGEESDHEHKKSSQGKGLIKDLFQQLKGDYTFGFKDGFSFDGSIPNG